MHRAESSATPAGQSPLVLTSATTIVEPAAGVDTQAEARSAREVWLGSPAGYLRHSSPSPTVQQPLPAPVVRDDPKPPALASNLAVTGTAVPVRTQVQIRRRIEDLCHGYAREVEVIPEPNNHLLIRIKAFSAAAEGQIGNQVRKLPDLKPYQVTLEITTAS
jgi:hypothetical protein